MRLSAATRALRDGRPAEALDALLDAWREVRDPGLADLIDRVGAKLAVPVPRLTAHRLHVQWMDRFVEGHPVDLPVLMEVWSEGSHKQVKQRLEALCERPPDPRITRPLVKGLTEGLGYSVTPAERTVWTRVLKLVVHTGDVRVCEGLEEIARVVQARVGAFGHEPYGYADLVERIHKTLPRIQAPDEALDLAALEEGVRALELAPPLMLSVARPERTSLRAEVRDGIYADPDDDGPIAVWADLLTEAGDDLGTFVTLQLRHAQKPIPKKDQSVMRRLQKANVARLLGPLAPVVDPKSAVFRRGLLYAAKVTLRTSGHRTELVHHPFWRSVRQIQTTSAHLRCESLARVERTGLRLVPQDVPAPTGPPGFTFAPTPPPAFSQLTELARSRTPLGLRSVCVGLPNRSILAADAGPLEEPKGLPDLDELHLVETLRRYQRDADPVARLGPLAGVGALRSVRRLVLDGLHGHSSPDVFTLWRDLGRGPGQELVLITESDWFLVLTGDSNGVSVDATIPSPGHWSVETLSRLLGVPARFDAVRVHSPPWEVHALTSLWRLLKPVQTVELPPEKLR